MSVSMLEVIEAGGYDLTTYEDANWLLSKRNELEELIERAETLVDTQNRAEGDEAVAEDVAVEEWRKDRSY